MAPSWFRYGRGQLIQKSYNKKEQEGAERRKGFQTKGCRPVPGRANSCEKWPRTAFSPSRSPCCLELQDANKNKTEGVYYSPVQYSLMYITLCLYNTLPYNTLHLCPCAATANATKNVYARMPEGPPLAKPTTKPRLLQRIERLAVKVTD